MENLKKIIIAILIIVIIIIIILSIILFLNKKNDNTINTNNVGISIDEVFNKENKIQKITKKAEYFNVKKCIEKYSSYSNDLYYAQRQGNKEYIEKIKEQLPSLIPDFVKQELDLTNENIYNKIGLQDKYIRIDSINKSMQTINTDAYTEETNIFAYIVEGVFIDRNNYEKEEFIIIAIMDIKNNTFLIVPQKYIEKVNLNLDQNNSLQIYNKKVIEKNNYNSFVYSKETEEDMAKEYINRFRMNLTYDSSYIYNNLDKEYSQARFGSYNDFKSYIEENKLELNKIKMKEYIVNYYDDYIEYVCKDQYDNLYIFNEMLPMSFTLKLDTYTITTDKFKSTYAVATDKNKAKMNIDKFFQMINRQDYKTSYNCIADSFKNNYFQNEEKFKQYVKQNFFLYNKISYKNVSDMGNGIYVYTLELFDFTGNKSEKKEITVIIRLKEELNFEMSFEM